MATCELCHQRPAIKTDGKSQEVCGPCARGMRPPFRYQRHVGRNDPCPCGSGQKAKRCGCGTRRNAQIPQRPAHWLPQEPLVVVMPETAGGFAEVDLELGGRIVATRVATPDNAQDVVEYFRQVIQEDFEAAQPRAPGS